MIKLTEVIVRRPVSAIVCIIAIVLFGVMSIMGMPQELTPEMNFPYLLIYTIYPTAGPEDVEKLVSQEVEGSVASLSGVKTIQSMSMENVSVVVMQYEYGTNMDIAYTDVKERLDSIANNLPDNSQRPIVMEMDMNAMPAISLSLRSSSGENLLGYIEEEIVPEFEKLSTVAEVSVSGGLEEYIRVELLEEKLQQYGVTMSTVVNSVSTADFSIPSGSANHGSQELSVRSSVEFKTVQALENIPIPLGGGGIIRLDDVANIYMTTQDAASISRYNGEDNIGLNIQKRQSASAVSTSRQVMQAVERLNAENNGITIDVVNDNSESIQDSLMSVGQTLIIAIFLSMLVLFVFLGDIKASVIVGCSMPVSLLVAFILMDFMGFTLNIITMSSMVLGVGMMVDNSIVVLDSCFKVHTRNKTFIESAIEGTKFVMGSIIGGTVTTVVVFLPLATIAGMAGQMFRPLGFTIVFSLLASLLSAITLVPLFFTQFQPVEKRRAPAALFLKKMERAYGNLLRRILKRKKTTVAVSLAIVVLSLFLATRLNFELIPSMDQGMIAVELETRPGLQIEKVDEITRGLEDMVASHPDVEHYTVSGGGSGINAMLGNSSATITAYLDSDRGMKTDEIIEQWRQETKGYLNCKVTVSSSSTTMSMSNDSMQIDLVGNDLDTLKEFAGEVEAVMLAHPDMITVSSSVGATSPQAEIVVDSMKAAAVSFTPMQVASNVSMALSGVETVDLRQDSQEYTIKVEYPQGRYNTVGDLEDLILVSATGASVPLTDIAEIVFTDTPQTIIRVDSQYYVSITGTPTRETRFTAEKDVKAQVEALRFPHGVELMDSTQYTQQNEELQSLFNVIIVAIFLVFMVMSIQFESIKHSLMVMICIPFSMIGSFSLMFLAGTTISMVSLLGFLILVGTVVNNGILFVDTANQYRKSMTVDTALIQTGRHRLRPILMTTLTTVLSMLPMVFATGSAEMMSGLGLVVIGGLTASTILTLLLLPVFYLIIDGNEEKKRRRAEKKRQKREEREKAAHDQPEYEELGV